jgi:hypothetical protein
MSQTNDTTRSPRLLALGTALVALVAASCSDAPSGIQPREDQQPGTASVAVTANPDGATAFVLRIAGGPVTDVRATGDAILYWEPETSGARAVVLLPASASATIASVSLPDIQALGRYSVTVLEAADVRNDPIAASSAELQLR